MKYFEFDPDKISQALDLEPDYPVIRKGESRNAPPGLGLEGAIYKYNQWIYVIDSEEGDGDFFEDLSDLLVYLDNRKEIFEKINKSNGKSFIAIDLPGDVNIGSVIGFKYLSILSDLRIDLSIEVFPNLRA